MSPDFVSPSEYKFYEERPQPPEGWPDRENPRAIRKSLDKAHDNVKLLVKENDRLRQGLLKIHASQRKWLKLLLTCLAALATSIASIFAWLIPYAIRGMAK